MTTEELLTMGYMNKISPYSLTQFFHNIPKKKRKRLNHWTHWTTTQPKNI